VHLDSHQTNVGYTGCIERRCVPVWAGLRVSATSLVIPVHHSLQLQTDILNVILYTRHGCHLCDDALALLQRHGVAPREVDIDGDAELRARYYCCVPVVEIDGRERFRGRVDERLLRRLLAAQTG
jgi:glutaredoxin